MLAMTQVEIKNYLKNGKKTDTNTIPENKPSVLK